MDSTVHIIPKSELQRSGYSRYLEHPEHRRVHEMESDVSNVVELDHYRTPEDVRNALGD